MKTYNVTIARTITQRLIIPVTAENDLAAMDIAEREEGNHDFNAGVSSDAEYEIENVQEQTLGQQLSKQWVGSI